MKKMKLIATIGLNSSSRSMIKRMANFVDGFRLNTSHKTVDEAVAELKMIREVAPDRFVFFDLRGPKIRTNDFGNGIRVSKGEVLAYGKDISFDPDISSHIPEGQLILIDDGRIRAVWRDGNIEIRDGGLLAGRKGVSVPGLALDIENPTERDREFINAGVEAGVDGFAISFVQSSDEVDRLKKMAPDAYVISKVETLQAVENIQDIAQASDIIMIARGDLGMEAGAEKLPLVQERIASVCREMKKPFIVATEVAQSLISQPRMTRAEASDIYLASMQMADAVMLSGETTLSEDPAAVAGLVRSVINEMPCRHQQSRAGSIGDVLGKSAVDMALAAGADRIIAFTNSGKTAMDVSYYRPCVDTKAVTFSARVARFLNLIYGIEPVLEEKRSIESMMNQYISEGRSVVFVAGSGISQGMSDFVRYVK